MTVPQSQLNGLAVVRIQGVYAGSVAVEETIHVRQATGQPHTAAGLAGVATAVANWWAGASGLKVQKNSNYFGVQVAVEDLSPARLATAVAALNAAGTGTTGNAAPSGASLVVKTQTGNLGVANRGRIFLGGFAAADLQSGGLSWSTTRTANCVSAITALLSAIASATPVNYTAVIWHRPPASARPATPALADTTTNILSASSDGNVRYQRRREFGRGA